MAPALIKSAPLAFPFVLNPVYKIVFLLMQIDGLAHLSVKTIAIIQFDNR